MRYCEREECYEMSLNAWHNKLRGDIVSGKNAVKCHWMCDITSWEEILWAGEMLWNVIECVTKQAEMRYCEREECYETSLNGWQNKLREDIVSGRNAMKCHWMCDKTSSDEILWAGGMLWNVIECVTKQAEMRYLWAGGMLWNVIECVTKQAEMRYCEREECYEMSLNVWQNKLRWFNPRWHSQYITYMYLWMGYFFKMYFYDIRKHSSLPEITRAPSGKSWVNGWQNKLRYLKREEWYDII